MSWITDAAVWEGIILTPPPPYNPGTDLPGLMSWWDAADAGTITASGTPLRVTALTDKSGQGNTLSASGGTGPKTGGATQNGLNIFEFDANSLEKTAWTTQVRTSRAITLFMVVSDNDSSQRAKFAINGVTNQDHQQLVFERTTATNVNITIGDGASQSSNADLWVMSATSFNNTATVRLYTVRINTSGMDFRVNGSTFTLGHSGATSMPYSNWLATAPGTWGVGVGRRFHSSGAYKMNDKCGEVLVSDQYLTGTDLTDAEAYLIAKWAL